MRHVPNIHPIGSVIILLEGGYPKYIIIYYYMILIWY